MNLNNCFLNLGSSGFGYLIVPLGIGLISGAWLNGQVARNCPKHRSVRQAFLMMSTGAVLNTLQALIFPGQLITFIPPLMFYTFGVGLAMPTRNWHLGTDTL